MNDIKWLSEENKRFAEAFHVWKDLSYRDVAIWLDVSVKTICNWRTNAIKMNKASFCLFKHMLYQYECDLYTKKKRSKLINLPYGDKK